MHGAADESPCQADTEESLFLSGLRSAHLYVPPRVNSTPQIVVKPHWLTCDTSIGDGDGMLTNQSKSHEGVSVFDLLSQWYK